MGGLGNQLFQLNKAIDLIDRGYNVKLINNLILRESIFASKILKWNIHDNVLQQIYDFGNIVTKKNTIPILMAKAKILDGFSNYYGLEYDVFPARNMFGYFQSKIKVNLRYGNFISSKKSSDVVMHIRMTDNNNFDFSRNYYLNVIRNLKMTHVKVVTDDSEGAKKFLERNTKVHYEIISSNTIDDFSALRGAKVVISAPSTFSFWAAISNETAEKVYVPETFLKYVNSPSKNWVIF